MAEKRWQPEQEFESWEPEELQGREFMAGWFDGLFSARASASRCLREELARWALTLDGEGSIGPLASAAPPSKQHGLFIDNPQHDPDYELGWERGFEQANHLIFKSVALELPRHGLSLVSKEGRPLPPAEVQEGLVDLYTVKIAATRPTRLDDAALHASLDHALQEKASSGISLLREAVPLIPESKSSRLLKTKGVLTMIRKHIDRRAAIISLSTVLACGTLSYVFWPRPKAIEKNAASVNPYVAPSWWTGLPARERKFFVALDKMFWQAEQTQPAPSTPPPATLPPVLQAPFNAASSWLQASMNLQGQDNIKSQLAVFVADSHRQAYLSFLLGGLAPGLSNAAARLTIVSSLLSIWHNDGVDFFTSPVANALLAAFNAEQDAVVQSRLDRLLTRLGVSH